MKSTGFLFIFSCLVLSCWIWAASVESDSAPCLDCHRKELEKDRARIFVHAPLQEGRCPLCHLREEFRGGISSLSAAKSEPVQRVIWFRESDRPAAEHWFRFPRDRVGESLWLRIRDGEEIFLFQIDVERDPSTSLQDDFLSPLIDNVSVSEIRRGLLATALIRWRTDEFSTGFVEYGEKGLDLRSRSSGLAREHEVVLTDLRVNGRYRFQVVSKDLFGNESRSGILELVTDADFRRESDAQKASAPGSAGEGWKADLRTWGEEMVLILESQKPVSAALGSLPPESEKAEGRAVMSEAGDHLEMRQGREIQVSACLQCHEKHFGAGSHPIGILPGPNMRAPEDYSLADGRITCTTCHQGHGSDHPFLLRRADRKTLCTACHRGY